MVMQLDSFLSAGWIAGFFFFWGNFGKEMRKLRRLRYQALELPFASVQELIDYLKPNTLEKDTAQIGTEIFALLVVGVLNFVASGVLAVGSVITANGYLLVLALATLVGGTIVLFETWYIVHYVSEIVGVLYDKLSAISKSAKES